MEIRVKGLTKHYVSEGKTVKALDNIDLTIPANTIFTLLGPSGCGKTTLLRCIVGLETPDDGEISIGGERSEEHTSELQSLMRISYAVFCLKKKKRRHKGHSKN